MLGHQLWRHFGAGHEVWPVLRRAPASYPGLPETGREHCQVCPDVTDLGALESLFERARPEVVFNCVGVVKQKAECADPVPTIAINALLPHRIAALCASSGGRLVHVSTDCVFSGERGGYTEADAPDAGDLYGRSKLLGEVGGAHAVTLRTSIIGRELTGRHGLVDWFLGSEGQAVRGFRKAIFSGVTTIEFGRIAERVLTEGRDMTGIWHVSAEPIDKFTLLTLLKDAYSWSGEIGEDVSVVCDRSLDSTRFRNRMGYRPPDWKTMVAELAAAPR